MNCTEVAQLITHNYDNPMYFIRPHYKATASTVSKVKDKVSKPKATKVKAKKILISAGHGYNDPGAVGNGTNERDFIRKYIAPNIRKYLKQAGHKVDLYGGSKQDQNLFIDTQCGERLGDTKKYGMYWVKQQKYDVVVELHLDAAGASATGGHVIISNQWPADSIDKNINNALKATVGTIRDIHPRNDLLNANVAGRLNINYRLVEMGFITNKNDMKYLKKNYDKFSKELAWAINGKPITGTSAGKKRITWNWKGRFYPNADKTGIEVRRKPGLKGAVVDKGSCLFTKDDWVDFVSVTKKDVIGGLNLNTLLIQALFIFIAQCVKSLTRRNALRKRNIGEALSGNKLIIYSLLLTLEGFTASSLIHKLQFIIYTINRIIDYNIFL